MNTLKLLAINGVVGLSFVFQSASAESIWMLIKHRDGYGTALEKIQFGSFDECELAGKSLQSNPRWDNGGERRFEFACIKGK
jgi:hypothetical protein